MKVIIAGSRTIEDYDVVKEAVKESGFEITEVVSGVCKGVDFLGERYAKENHIPIKRFYAVWSKGKMAGPLRNSQMVEYADALIAVWDGESRGTKDVTEKAKHKGLKVHIKKVVVSQKSKPKGEPWRDF